MCGIPGSGKSTWIRQKKSELPGHTVIISRDEVRFKMLEESDEYFAKEKEVFKKFISLIECALLTENTSTVVADATHLSPASRKKLLANLSGVTSKMKDLQIIAVVINIPLEVALERNAHREGRAYVPPSAIKNMFNSFSLPTLDEGFDEIYIYKLKGLAKIIAKEK